MSIEIVPMTREDEVRGKAYVHFRAWKDAYRGLVDQDFLDARTLELSEGFALKAFEAGFATLLAKDGDRVVGFADYGPCRDEDLPDTGEVYAIYLLEPYYHQGIGTMLMREALARMAAYPRVAVWVLEGNDRAISFYESFGFAFDGSAKTLKLGTPVTDLRMLLLR